MTAGRPNIARLTATLMLLAFCASAQAVTVERMQLAHESTHYTVAALMTLNVAPATAYRAATDYERPHA